MAAAASLAAAGTAAALPPIELSDVAAGDGGFLISGIDAYDRSGNSVSGAGDVNGDGLADVIVGARNAGPNPANNPGESYVIFGKADGGPVDLADILDGIGGFVISGVNPFDFSGFSVSGAGDVNGDLLDDVIIGAYLADPGGIATAGQSYVVFGKADTTPVDLSVVASGGGGGFVINGIATEDFSGFSVSGAGDVNGDMLDDVIVGAHKADPNTVDLAGESYVVFGKVDSTPVDLADIADEIGGGFVINGIDVHDHSGRSVSGAGDVNGDGLDDVIVGAFYAYSRGNSFAGKSYVVFGKASATAVSLEEVANGIGGFAINGIDPSDQSGGSVAGAGDVNNDGLADLIVGAAVAAQGGNNQAGESYVIFGKADTTPVELAAIAAGVGGFVITGIDFNDLSGYSVSGAGDVNGDGFDDVIIGAPNGDPGPDSQEGESYVVFGKAGTTPVSLADVIVGIGGFVINGIDADDHAGISVSGAGDVNADGLADVIVGAYWASPPGALHGGESYVVFGPLVPTDVTWTAPSGGDFSVPANWDTGNLPTLADTVIFDGIGPLPPSYQVNFVVDEVTDRLRVSSTRDIDFRLLDTDYVVAGEESPAEPSIIVGELADLDVRLSILNFTTLQEFHGVFASTVSVGDGPGSIGSLTATGAFTLLDMADLWVGPEGSGTVVVEQGASATAAGDVSIGALAGGVGELRVSGAGSVFTYEGIGAQTPSAMVVGDAGTGTLIVSTGGSLVGTAFTDHVSIGRQLGSVGDVLLTGAGSQWTATGSSFYVGESGQASLTIAGGAQLLTTTSSSIFLGLAGPSASVTVTGPGSAWVETFSSLFISGGVGSVTVTVADGGVIQFPVVQLLPGAEVRGDGTLVGEVFSVGRIRPGQGAVPSSSGVLTVDGSYRQIEIGEAEFSGSLLIDIGGTTPGVDYDQLVVTGFPGQAELGGGLFINLVSPFEPQPGQTFDILAATQITETFDVAFMPGFDDRFLLLKFGAGAAAGGGETATVSVQTLSTLLGFDPQTPVSITGVPSDVVVGDFDGVNGPDLAVSLGLPGNVVVVLNDGSGGFAGAIQTPVGSDLSGIAAGDFDGDTVLDVAVTDRSTSDLFILPGNGDGSFGAGTTMSVGVQPEDVAAANVFEDGNLDIDLIVASSGDNKLRVLANDGTGVFSQLSVLNTGLNPIAVDPSDLDNDKDVDALIASNLGSDNVSIFGILGGGSFSAATNVPVGDAPVDLATDDFDGNGFRDIVTANSGDGTVSVVLNNGDGTFAPAVHLPVGDQPRSLTAIDLEGDADPDLAVVADDALGDPAVLVLRNDRTGGQLIFAPADAQAVGDNPVLVTAADLDADGQEDLVTVNDDTGAAAGPALSSVDARLNTTVAVQPCPWDCGVENGGVDIVDFLSLLAQWGQVASSCDIDGGGVGINDFLALLAHWGACP